MLADVAMRRSVQVIQRNMAYNPPHIHLAFSQGCRCNHCRRFNGLEVAPGRPRRAFLNAGSVLGSGLAVTFVWPRKISSLSAQTGTGEIAELAGYVRITKEGN